MDGDKDIEFKEYLLKVMSHRKRTKNKNMLKKDRNKIIKSN